MTEKCAFVTRAGTPIDTVDVPVVDGKRPDYVLRSDRLFRHYKGRTAVSPAEYRETAPVVVLPA